MMIKKLAFTPQNIKCTPRFSSTETERHTAFKEKSSSIPDARWVKTSYVPRPEFSEYSIVQIEAVVWDSEHHCFFERYEKFHHENDSSRKMGVTALERKIIGNYVLESGVYVDNTNQRLILPNGTWIDGPSGELFSVHGEPFAKPQIGFNKEM